MIHMSHLSVSARILSIMLTLIITISVCQWQKRDILVDVIWQVKLPHLITLQPILQLTGQCQKLVSLWVRWTQNVEKMAQVKKILESFNPFSSATELVPQSLHWYFFAYCDVISWITFRHWNLLKIMSINCNNWQKYWNWDITKNKKYKIVINKKQKHDFFPSNFT